MNSHTVAQTTSARKSQNGDVAVSPRLLQPVCQITFRWPGYDPRQALAFFDPTPVDVFRLDARAADLPRLDGQITCGDIYQYMLDHDLVLFGKPSYRQPDAIRRWAGAYTLILAREISACHPERSEGSRRQP